MNFKAIEDILLDSPPPKLETIALESVFGPPKLRNSSDIFQAARKLTAFVPAIGLLKLGGNLEELEVRAVREGGYLIDGRNFPVLPRITSFARITRRELSSLKLHQVSELHIEDFRSDDNEASSPCPEICLPKLTKLNVGFEGLYSLRNLTAPALEDLEIVSGISQRDLAGYVHTITVRPISLRVSLWEDVLDLDMKKVLTSWDQLEHLYVSCKSSVWTDTFESRLVGGLLFPWLKTLKVGIYCSFNGEHERTLDTFRGFAEKMLRARKGLKNVAWRLEWDVGNEWHKVSTV